MNYKTMTNEVFVNGQLEKKKYLQDILYFF